MAAGARAAGVLGTVVAEAKAAAVAFGALSSRAREKRLRALEDRASNVRTLLLLLRRSLIAG